MKHLVNSFSQPQPAAHGFSRLLPQCMRLGAALLVLVSFQSAFGFSLIGPFNEAYQVPAIGYHLSGADKVFGNGSVDIGAPKDFNQGYRRNTPVMYYTMDANFLTFFGARGIDAVDAAYQVFNNLPPVSQMTPDLSEYQLNTMRVNPTAEALFLSDVKSTLMSVMMEELGMAEPERFIWAMHDRYLPSGGTCPIDEEYLIWKLNFDPVTFQPSSYVNGTLYTYLILENCDAPPPPVWRALCEPIAVDPTADTFTALASGAYLYGTIYTGLTRDDVGGIRYLLRTNNMAVESPPFDSTTFVTNTTQPVLLTTSNLTQFAQQALLTNALALEALYPGLVVASSTNYPVYQWVTNITIIGYTTKPLDPAGTVPYIPVYQTNRTLTVQLNYQHTYANLVTFSNTPNGWVTVPVTSLAPFKGRGFATLQTSTVFGTNVFSSTSRTFLTNEVVGDFAILPTNACGFQVVFPLLTNVYTVTNLLTGTNSSSGTNVVTSGNGTNSITVTNLLPQVVQTLIQYYTNHTFWVYNVDCQSNAPALRQGIEKITFVRRDFDSLLNRFFAPVTNQYTMMVVTNSTLVPQVIERIITGPDILLTAEDLNAGPGDVPVTPALTRSILFNTNDVPTYYPGYAGPGTIEPVTRISFNIGSPVFYNFGRNASEATQFGPTVMWGSFDMSTNPPVVYPSRTSLADLENLVLIQVTPAYLPEAAVNTDYQVQLETQGATPNWQEPFTWELAPGSPALPDGLTVNPDGSITGVPTTSGSYNFVVRVTDNQGRIYNRAYPLTVK